MTETKTATTLDDDAKRMLVLKLLKQHYAKDSKESNLYQLVKTLNQLKPILLNVGDYQLLINKKENFAFTNNLDKVISYFGTISENKSVYDFVRFNVLDPEEFEPIYNEMLQNHAKKYHLTSVLWQIYNESIPDNFNYKPHSLLLKVQQMPNFSEIPSAPVYTSSLLSSCMLEAKNLKELKLNFKSVHPKKLHRIFFLSVLSGIADMNVLADSLDKQFQLQDPSNHDHESDSNPDKTQYTEAQTVSNAEIKKKPMLEYERIVAETLALFDKKANQLTKKIANPKSKEKTTEISRAKKTGFFARMLNKLSS